MDLGFETTLSVHSYCITYVKRVLFSVKNIGTVKILLESGASFYLKDKDGNIPLSLPFMSGKHALDLNPKRDVIIMKMLSTLLEKGACPNTQPDGEDTPLMLAADNCLPECVKLLLEFGAHSDHIGKDGLTALHKCISATGLSSIMGFAHLFLKPSIKRSYHDYCVC